MRTQTHLQDSVPQKPIAWRALEQARKQVPRVSPLQQPPIFHAHHTISQEPDHPASLFLPLVATCIKHSVEHWNVMDVNLWALQKITGRDWISKVRGVKDPAEGICMEKSYVRWQTSC